MSPAIATIILRTFSACASSPLRNSQLVQLRQAVDDPGDLVAELLLDVPEADIRVLDRVVQERRGEGRGVEP